MDETALTMNMPSNKAVHKIGSKTICIKTQRQEKARVSVILACCANGVKLKPFIIFKGAKNGCIYKKLIKEIYVKEKKAEIYVNSKVWATIEIIKLWIENIYIPFFKNKDLKKTLLIWDNATMHTSLISKFLYEKGINYVLIPKGLTSILQPLDVSINRPFKDWMKRTYESSIAVFKTGKVPKIKREIILKWIVDNNWFDDSKIKTEIIINSFLVCGISNKMDGSQDEKFEGFDKINEQGFIEQDFTKEDEVDMNNNVNLNDTNESEMGSSDEEIDEEDL